MDRESAKQRNATHATGTLVRVSLRNGETISAPTAAYAQEWGEFALVTLQGVPGLWTVAALSIES